MARAFGRSGAWSQAFSRCARGVVSRRWPDARPPRPAVAAARHHTEQSLRLVAPPLNPDEADSGFPALHVTLKDPQADAGPMFECARLGGRRLCEEQLGEAWCRKQGYAGGFDRWTTRPWRDDDDCKRDDRECRKNTTNTNKKNPNTKTNTNTNTKPTRVGWPARRPGRRNRR